MFITYLKKCDTNHLFKHCGILMTKLNYKL